jgi:hypothetical protein
LHQTSQWALPLRWQLDGYPHYLQCACQGRNSRRLKYLWYRSRKHLCIFHHCFWLDHIVLNFHLELRMGFPFAYDYFEQPSLSRWICRNQSCSFSGMRCISHHLKCCLLLCGQGLHKLWWQHNRSVYR